MRRSLPLLLALLPLGGCVEPVDEPPDDPTPGESEHIFSFAVLADPHVTSVGDNLDRLQTAIDWVEEEAPARRIELVLVVGDIAWGDGMEPARDAMDGLSVPYVPLIGDNEIQVGMEQDFDLVFGPRLAGLEPSFDGFERAELPVWNPEHEQDSWFQNLTFEHKGVTFVGLDWAHRTTGSLVGESAELYDFEGGTWQHFLRWLEALPDDGPKEDVVLASHHPMHWSPGAFSSDEMDRIVAVTGPLTDRVFANFAGHYHFDAMELSPDGSYEVVVTDATWDDEITVRLVEVWSDGEWFEYRQEVLRL